MNGSLCLRHLRCSTKTFSSFILAIFIVFAEVIVAADQQPQNMTDICAKACVPITYESYIDPKDKLNVTLPRHPKPGTAGVCLRCDEFKTECKRAQLPTICPRFVNSTTQYLDMQSNNIGPTLNDSLMNATSLIMLDLSRNRLEGVTRKNLQSMKNLESLDLSGNSIRADFAWEENMFADMNNLSELHLSNLHLTHIPASFFANTGVNNTVLTKLDLSNNELTEIPFDALERLPYLLELDLSGNKIGLLTSKTTDNGVRRVLKLEHLKVLKLTGLNLRNIEAGTFIGLPALKLLELSHNSDLVEIDRDAFGKVSGKARPFMKLESLLLNNCGLKRLNQSMIEWEELKVLRVDDNPWSCDCWMRWALSSWFLPKNTKLKNVDYVKCSFPRVNENHLMNTLTAESMPCEDHVPAHRHQLGQFDDDQPSSYSPVAKFFIILFMLCISASILGGIFVLYRRARGAAAGRNVPYRAVFNQGHRSRDEHAGVFDGGDDDDGLPSRSPYEI